MTSYRLKNVLLVAAASLSALLGLAMNTQANTLDDILDVSTAKTDAARESQAKVDRLADETRPVANPSARIDQGGPCVTLVGQAI